MPSATGIPGRQHSTSSRESGDLPSKRRSSTGRGCPGEGCTWRGIISRLQSRASARPAISIVQLRSQQPACPDFCKPEKKDRKSVLKGKSVDVGVGIDGRRIIKKKKKENKKKN